MTEDEARAIDDTIFETIADGLINAVDDRTIKKLSRMVSAAIKPLIEEIKASAGMNQSSGITRRI